MAKAVFALALFATAALAAHNNHHNVHTTAGTTATPLTDHQLLQKLAHEYDAMHRNMESLTRQVMLQQLFVEERIRSDGDSGLKQIRHHTDGTRAYFSEDHNGRSIAAIHEHANNIRTVGMGELNMVINGVDFRTRHNDYRLRMPNPNSNVYNSLVDIPFPGIPPAVTAKHTLAEQITEMREWFKAWKNEDHSHRDYRKFFKPVLCYMEAGWTTNTKTLEEPFFSDRHHIDASSWFDLQDKVRFTSYSGGKSTLENYAYLPTTILNVVNGTADYAQWNYRIACHPLKDYLSKRTLHLVDDLKERVTNVMNMTKYSQTRRARFTVVDRLRAHYRDRGYKWGVLDDLMYQIPGKNSYHGRIQDNEFGETAYHIKSTNPKILTPLNTAFYHRWYKSDVKDAMGQTVIHRGFADQNMFVAQTTQPQIAPMTVHNCRTHKVQDPNHLHHRITVKNCTTYTQRYTYAVPLEIIYLTPLYTWNPYKLVDHGNDQRPVTFGGRNGGFTRDKAYNGTYSRLHYWTPSAFFSSGEVNSDRADTAKGTIGVLDGHGVVRNVTASGTRIFLPQIDGVGKLRTRYPIMPVHVEGSAAWKELDALKAMVMDMPTYSPIFEREPTSVSKANALLAMQITHFQVPPTSRDPPGLHSHEIEVHGDELQDLKDGKPLLGIFTSISNGHQHAVDIIYNKATNSFEITSCDGLPKCWDGHDIHLIKED